jgi:hypothetical protein
MRLLFQALDESRRYVAEHVIEMVPPEEVDFLATHVKDTHQRPLDFLKVAGSTTRV